MESKKSFVSSGIGQIVTRNVGHSWDSIINVVLIRMVNDIVRNTFCASKHSHIVVQSGQIYIDHFSMISHPHLKKESRTYYDFCNIFLENIVQVAFKFLSFSRYFLNLCQVHSNFRFSAVIFSQNANFLYRK